ncbi:MAG: hypothetical protein AAFU57_10805 [Bacteroidota bacterium]
MDSIQSEEQPLSLVDTALINELDSLKQAVIQERKAEIYPFNPNYLTDFKAYTLGISPEEVDRLFAFRKNGEYIQSTAQFQEVTQVSDSLLFTLQLYFKFKQTNFAKQKTINNHQVFSEKPIP